MKWKMPGCLLGFCLQLMTFEQAMALPASYLQGFEHDTTGWTDGSLVERVRSGSSSDYADNARAAIGRYYARLSLGEATSCAPSPGTTYAGPSTELGCYGCVFPTVGFRNQVRVYLDTTYAASNPDKGFDLTSAINGTDCNHRRDFAFNATTCGPGQTITCGTSESAGFIIGTSNGAGRCGLDQTDPAREPIYVTISGWYTFEHVFRNVEGMLDVTLNLRSPSGSLVKSWNRSSPLDDIASVGGNRFVWFANNQIPDLAIDNVVRSGGQVCGDYACKLKSKAGTCHVRGELTAPMMTNSTMPSTIAVRCSNGAHLRDEDATVISKLRSEEIIGRHGKRHAKLTLTLPDSILGTKTSRLQGNYLHGDYKGACTITQPTSL